MKTTQQLGLLCSSHQANCECTDFGYYWNFRPGREQELLCDDCRESHLLRRQDSRGPIREAWQKYEHRSVNIDGLGRPHRRELILMHSPEPVCAEPVSADPVSAFDDDSDEEDEEIEAFIEMESEDAGEGEESEESEEGEEGEESEEDEEDEELPYDGYHGGEEYLDTLES